MRTKIKRVSTLRLYDAAFFIINVASILKWRNVNDVHYQVYHVNNYKPEMLHNLFNLFLSEIPQIGEFHL